MELTLFSVDAKRSYRISVFFSFFLLRSLNNNRLYRWPMESFTDSIDVIESNEREDKTSRDRHSMDQRGWQTGNEETENDFRDLWLESSSKHHHLQVWKGSQQEDKEKRVKETTNDCHDLRWSQERFHDKLTGDERQGYYSRDYDRGWIGGNCKEKTAR